MKDNWWMSFPNIESRKIEPEPFGPHPVFDCGDIVILKQRPERKRKVLEVQWHMHRYQWVYVIETSCSDENDDFEPYWFEDKLRKV